MRRRKNRRAFLMTAIVAAVIATGAYAYTNAIGGVTPPNLGSRAQTGQNNRAVHGARSPRTSLSSLTVQPAPTPPKGSWSGQKRCRTCE